MKKIINKELYDKLVCALLHKTCGECTKCGDRLEIIKELSKETGHELPWKED